MAALPIIKGKMVSLSEPFYLFIWIFFLLQEISLILLTLCSDTFITGLNNNEYQITRGKVHDFPTLLLYTTYMRGNSWIQSLLSILCFDHGDMVQMSFVQN